MKLQPSTLLSRSACRHLYESGRRCRFPVLPNAQFCVRHIQDQLPPNLDSDLTRDFGPHPVNFQSASEVNDFLCSLAKLMIENRISARRASVLAYIASLELRTLPAMDHEFDANNTFGPMVFDRPASLEPSVHATSCEPGQSSANPGDVTIAHN
jgi:hypothetical protein